MNDKSKYPITLAIRELTKNNVEFSKHLYDYVEKGGTAVSSQALQVPEHSVIKTLVMETDQKIPIVVLMHGDRHVSTKQLARTLQVKSVSPCSPETAEKYTGYQVGGTSPFGMRKKISVYLEITIQDLEKIYINGGKRGFLVGVSPRDIVRVLKPNIVNVAIEP